MKNEKLVIEVVKEFSFDSAHCLPRYDGKCKGIHGHRWMLHVGFKGSVDPATGMVIDFVDIKRIVKQLVIDKLDHKLLNELQGSFPGHNPTAENILTWIVWVLNAMLTSDVGTALIDRVSFVRLYETPTSYAEWRRKNV